MDTASFWEGTLCQAHSSWMSHDNDPLTRRQGPLNPGSCAQVGSAYWSLGKHLSGVSGRVKAIVFRLDQGKVLRSLGGPRSAKRAGEPRGGPEFCWGGRDSLQSCKRCRVVGMRTRKEGHMGKGGLRSAPLLSTYLSPPEPCTSPGERKAETSEF